MLQSAALATLLLIRPRLIRARSIARVREIMAQVSPTEARSTGVTAVPGARPCVQQGPEMQSAAPVKPGPWASASLLLLQVTGREEEEEKEEEEEEKGHHLPPFPT